MNVGTQAAIKGGLSAEDLRGIGCQVELSNTYHLHLRPGDERIRELGGLHTFMDWNGPILTDSGGFQIFSLSGLRKLSEEGVRFASHLDGRRVFMRPEDSVRIQQNLGSDIIMALDECCPNPSPYEYVKASAERTARWLARCTAQWRERGPVNPDTLLFGINQGGTYDDLRVEHMKTIAELDLPGYAVGGLAVGEPTEVMYHILEVLQPHLPADKPRYLMGVGTPANILQGVARGIDFFDCVMPARNARHGHLFTWNGVINILNERHQRDARPPDEACGCPTCRRHSRAYLRHLFKAGELLGLRLAVLHNLYFYNELMKAIRERLEQGLFEPFCAEYTERLQQRA
jgi:queuine tRNA-ribosyltransferase